MTYPAFPLNHQSQGWDSSQYEVSMENPTASMPMDGGYTYSRAKFTRAPRRTFKMSWVSMNAADYQTLQTFWTTSKGSAAIFDWYDPGNDRTYHVRFKEKDGLVAKYLGMGTRQLWAVTLQFDEV